MKRDGHDTKLQKSKVKNLAKDTTDSRISDDAVLRALLEMEDEFREVFMRAKEMANHADRATIMEEDIMMALRYRRREE